MLINIVPDREGVSSCLHVYEGHAGARSDDGEFVVVACPTDRRALHLGMERYANPGSGIRAYEVEGNSIVLEFADGGLYLYDEHVPGAEHVAAMARLARSGRGLNTYVNQHIRKRFARRLR